MSKLFTFLTTFPKPIFFSKCNYKHKGKKLSSRHKMQQQKSNNFAINVIAIFFQVIACTQNLFLIP